MARYSAELNKGTTSTTIGVGSIEAPGSGMRRIKLYDLLFSSEATPADNAFLFRAKRSSTASTGTSVTPSPLDPADAACVALAKENLSAEGTGGVVLFSWAMNQRASLRWVCKDGSELVIAATAAAGIIIETPVAINTPAATVEVFFEEQ
jgi:hypothetical protein